ncbi:type IA DNA topoisomerase [Chryseobacterium polytrichastri]|uniref:DNA topoisomerase n=1 Tax=Chryseobacterium polytrichastri TaxID=1302687 RepID=A0A1M6VVN3_9FLAO|nr:type IA DNA topoisomerase [Chryseobacterium polytrichastri]SHK85523.1 DNA topoisomerase-3 [Chryseobacterium polytrichastri]
MKLVIAEKPSVGREIAALLGAHEKKEGYFYGNGYSVTWAFGHLISLAMPEEYGVSGFTRERLPILPDPFILIVKKIRKAQLYVVDQGAAKQLKIIDGLMKQCESIIVATDAGREGELIFRYIYDYLNGNKPFERLWISSLTEKAIRKGFENVRPGHDFDSLYQAGLGRSRADWLVGINASQALSIAAGSGIYSLGRVQTPTLALICKRYLENRNFAIQPYWQIRIEHRKEYIDFTCLSKEQWKDKKSADDVLKSIQRKGVATVITAKTKSISEQSPLLFDLTGLQKECNKKFNFSAEETLNIAQSLYEKRFITYPRTGSCCIPEDVWPEIPHLIRCMREKESLAQAVAKIMLGQLAKRIVNPLKVTDHHGLLITDKMPSALSVKESTVYDVIALRLLEAVSPPCQKEITHILTEVNHYEFSCKGVRIREAGWRNIQGGFGEENEDPIQELPSLITGDELKIKVAGVLEKKTRPPVLFTEAGLLSAMENCGKGIQIEEERKVLQAAGIGTPATRAAIIETLFKRDYMIRKNKALVPTEKGLKVYDLIKDKKIADASMTAQWELALQHIENGESDVATFQKGIEEYVSVIIRELLACSIAHEQIPELLCPRCKKHPLLLREKVVKCSDESCGWLQFRMICGKQLKVKDIKDLIDHKKTSLIKGMKSKAGKKFDAFIVMNDQGETSFMFEK